MIANGFVLQLPVEVGFAGLLYRGGLDDSQMPDMTHSGGHAAVARPACVDVRGHEVGTQGVPLQPWRDSGGIAEVGQFRNAAVFNFENVTATINGNDGGCINMGSMSVRG